MNKQVLALVFLLLIPFQSKSITLNLSSKLDDACNEGIGYIEVYAIGGIAPLLFQWSGGTVSTNGSNSRSSNLVAGTYTVTVYDGGGDSATTSISIINYPSLDRNGTINYIFSAIDPNNPGFAGHPCTGQNNGMMFGHLEFTGGVSPFTAPGIVTIYNTMTGTMNSSAFAGITTGPDGEIIQVINLASYDTYVIETHDAGGCLGTFNGQMMGPDPFYTLAINTLPSCNGLNNGSASIVYAGTNPWPLNFTVYDSVTNAIVTASSAWVFPNFLVSDTFLPGSYYVNISYSNTTVVCDSNIYFSISDAGTSCGTISGKVFLDTIANCALDVNEAGLPSQIVRLTPGPYYSTTDANGDFNFDVPYGNYNLEQVISNYYGYAQTYFPVCSTIPATINGSTQTAIRNIGDSANIVYDLSVGLTSSAARPGFNLHYSLTVINNSFITSISPLVTLSVDPVLNFVSCNFPYTDLGGGVYTVQLGASDPFDHTMIQFVFNLPPNPALIGTTLSANVTVADVVTEINTINNSFSYSHIITGSFDPNDKTVYPLRNPANFFVLGNDTTLTYTIRFQNTGTDTAFNVVIVDTLDANLDINTLNVKAGSHEFHWELTGANILKFYFENILLPDSNTSEEQSHGAVTYSITPVNPGSLGNTINNKADIFFDFNPPVETNVVSLLVVTMVGLNENQTLKRNAVVVPNPAIHEIKILLNNDLQNDHYTFRIFNLHGQELMEMDYISNESVVSLQSLTSGCYFYQLEKEGRVIDQSQGKIILNK